MVFPVVMRGCESWTVKKAERPRTDAFELWCWRRLLRVPRTARRSNQSTLKETSSGCSLEGLMMRLKLQYFGHLMRRVEEKDTTEWLNWTECFFCCCCSVAQSCLTLWGPVDCSTPGFPVLHHLLELAQTHVHWVGNAIQPSQSLSSPVLLPPIFPQHQGLF